MSFNIRYGTANDGDNHWTRRREMLFDVVREHDADLIGVQEALATQIDEMIAAAPAYAVVGVGRDDGRARGEFSAILFRRDRFRVADSGTFWFSDTPAVPGSKSWGNSITRIATWARLIDRDGTGFYHFNLHLDHLSQPSRERSTELLLQRIAARAVPAEPVVVTGDFNVGEGNPALGSLLGTAGAPGAPFVDTFRVKHPDAKEVGTFNGFKFGATTGDKIDYVLVSPATEVIDGLDRPNQSRQSVSIRSLSGRRADPLQTAVIWRSFNTKGTKSTKLTKITKMFFGDPATGQGLAGSISMWREPRQAFFKKLLRVLRPLRVLRALRGERSWTYRRILAPVNASPSSSRSTTSMPATTRPSAVKSPSLCGCGVLPSV